MIEIELSRRPSMKLKHFRIFLVACLVTTSLLCGGGAAYAQDEQLPDPGITPDSPFYFLDVWGKKAGLLFAFSAEAKAGKALEYAEERLAEAQAMAARNKIREVQRAANGYDEFLGLAFEKAVAASNQGVSENAIEAVALTTSKHLSVLDRVKDAIPVEAEGTINRAQEASINGYTNALLVLAEKKPERATEINLTTIEGRLNRAKARAEVPEAVEEALSDAEGLFGLGETVSEIARGLGKGMAVEELVARATSNHLEVLAEIHEKVPEQARMGVETAMRASVRDHERAVETLKEGALSGVAENITIPERILAEVQEKLRLRVSTEATVRVSENKTIEGEIAIPERVREEVKEQLRQEEGDKTGGNDTAVTDNTTGKRSPPKKP